MPNGNNHFILIEESEIQSVLHRVVKNKGQATIWCEKLRPYEIKINEINIIKDKFVLNISSVNLNPNDENKTSFKFFIKISNLHFFSKCEINLSQTIPTLTLDNNVYKYEKRKNERLLTFPHRSIYINYIFPEIKKESSENVFNLMEKNSKKNIKTFKQIKKDEEQLLGEVKSFRCLDLSFDGVSFIVNSIEKDAVKNLYKTGAPSVSIGIDSQTIEVKKTELRYSVNYIDPRTNISSMYKMAIFFPESNEKLKSIIKNYLEPPNEKIILENEFDFFLNNKE